MAEFIKDVLNAILILPFTAGNYNVGSSSYDGTISGPVIFTTLFAILCQTLIIGSINIGEHYTAVDVSSLLMTIWMLLAIVCCAGISIYSYNRQSITVEIQNWDVSTGLNIRFYWLFALASITYYIIKICYYIECFHLTHQNIYIPEAIAYEVSFSLFCLFQTAFFTRYIHFKFIHNIGVYYGLMLLGVTNISIFVRKFAILYNESSSPEVYNDTSKSTVISTCKNVSYTYQILSTSRTFLHPAIFEFLLLSMIFLIKVWPSCQTSRKKNIILNSDDGDIYNTDPDDEDESNYLISHTQQSIQTDFTSLSMNTNAATDINRRTRKFIIIALGVIVHVPASVLHILQQTGPSSILLKRISQGYNAVYQFIILCLRLSCFYVMRCQCEPRRENVTFSASKYLLLVSSWGIISYFSIKVYEDIFSHTEWNYMLGIDTATVICRMISIYIQTVFLLQIGSYQKKNGE